GIIENRAREERKLSDAQADIARYQTMLAALGVEAQVQHASLLPEAIQTNQRRLELAARIQGHRAALASSCGGFTLDEFIAHVRATNLDLLPAELEQAHD